MKKTYLFLFLLFAGLFLKAQPVKIMLVTGGHGFDTIQFFQMFDELPGITYQKSMQPEANALLANGAAKDFDVLVFYDMWNTISDEEKKAYIELTKAGKPFLFMHHSIASYQNWPEFEKILGGKYVEKNEDIPEDQYSTYEHDVWVYGRIIKNHKVTSGLSEIRLFDEIYGNLRISDKIVPLIKTTHPKSSEYIAWENRYNMSKIIYLQSGHDKRTYISEDFRKLVLQSINYLANSN